MSTETFVVSSGAQVLRVIGALKQLTFGGRQWVLTLEPVEPKSRTWQKAKLRAIEGDLARHLHSDPRELHETLLAGRFGTQQVKVRGAVLLERPARRSSDLGESEMDLYILWVQALAANLGCHLQ